MFVLFLIYHAKYLRHYLSKNNGYVDLKRKCYPLYVRKTCGPVFVVIKIPVSGNLPTLCSPPQCQNVIYAPAAWLLLNENPRPFLASAQEYITQNKRT